MVDDPKADAALIEADILRTQDELGDTLGKLEEQLTPPAIARSLIGDDGTDIVKEAIELTRQNPVPVALIAIGVIWLIATARTRNGSRLAELLAREARPGKSKDRWDAAVGQGTTSYAHPTAI